MILSFHPCFEYDKNIICAGRDPGADELAAIKAADAVILPQGCRELLYKMAQKNCRNVFPNYDARFKYPGKIGQIRLFQETDTPHPKTEIYHTVGVSPCAYPATEVSHSAYPVRLPFVFKFDWGGEGDNVFLIKSDKEFQNILKKAEDYEKTGQSGFIIQEYIRPIPRFVSENNDIPESRTLRVVVIGTKIISYWRIQKNPEKFHANIAKGGVTDADSDPDLQEAAKISAKDFCQKTGINLAGFDFLFSWKNGTAIPLFLEINYFFGRHGLGGSEKFYELLDTEIKNWIKLTLF